MRVYRNVRRGEIIGPQRAPETPYARYFVLRPTFFNIPDFLTIIGISNRFFPWIIVQRHSHSCKIISSNIIVKFCLKYPTEESRKLDESISRNYLLTTLVLIINIILIVMLAILLQDFFSREPAGMPEKKKNILQII
jgi:hypothetical protein